MSLASLTALPLLLMLPGTEAPDPGPVRPAPTDTDRWVVEASEAVEMIRRDPGRRPTLLDVRGPIRFLAGHVDGARRVEWTDFTPADLPERGKLLPDTDSLQARLRELGVSGDRPVLVYGDPLDGWGEEGRIVWMLRTLGHPAAAMVDGGYDALVEAGAPVARGRAGDVPAGDFRVQLTDAFRVDREEVRAAVDRRDVVILDTRSGAEYRGATPYGEARGGHVPGAVHLHYRELLDERGRLRPEERIRERLGEVGITRDVTVHAYCTGGVRSGWMVAVLEWLGYDARNYAGSMWEWAAGPPERYPLE
jgi:thiosulfate/3-mercaptopyruvate sulfurtransferase